MWKRHTQDAYEMQASGKVRVAVMREEGSNGDREMAAAVYSGGMEPWDVTMSDLLNGRASLDSFHGKQSVIFVRYSGLLSMLAFLCIARHPTYASRTRKLAALHPMLSSC